LIPGKIIEIVATRCHISRPRCTKFDFDWGAYSAPPDPLVVFKRPTSKGREGRGGERRGEKKEGRGRKGEGYRAMEGRRESAPQAFT